MRFMENEAYKERLRTNIIEKFVTESSKLKFYHFCLSQSPRSEEKNSCPKKKKIVLTAFQN